MRVRTVVVVHRQPLVAEAIASARERYPWLAPIAIASRVEEAVRARADVIVIDADLEGAAEAVRTLRGRGRNVVVLGDPIGESSGSIATDRTVEELANGLAPGMGVSAPSSEPLTGREREILGLVAKGLAGKQVASLLGISPKTVEQHKTHIYGKLGVANQAAAVAVTGRSREGVTWISSTI